MEHKYIPNFIKIGTFYAWRFVAGAFGKKIERPWREQICGPFWISLLGLTLGLPIVLLGYGAGAVFGSEKLENKFDKFMDSKAGNVSKRLGMVILVLIMLFVVVSTVIIFINSTEALLGILIGIAFWLILYGIIILSIFVKDHYYENESDYEQLSATFKKKVKIAKTIRFVFLAIFFAPIVLWKILRFIGYMFYSGYKKFCPVVEVK